jgi:flavorubredoxin
VTTATEPVEIVPGSLVRLGAVIVLDGRVSWVPRALRAYQHQHCYLVLEKEGATLIDTGSAVFAAEIVAQLKQALPAELPLTVFLTRAEYEGVGNVGAVHEGVGIDQLYAGGFPNIFDAYNEVAGFTEKWDERTYMDRILPGDTIVSFGDTGRLEVLGAPLRILTGFWVYDHETKTLFTSDVFGHTHVDGPDASPILESLGDDPSTYESVKAHVQARFRWLATGSQTTAISENLEKIFQRDIETLAPMHGCVLRGRDLVQKHYEFLQRILAEAREVKTR